MVAPIPVGLCLCTVLALVERDNSSEDIAYVLYRYWMRDESEDFALVIVEKDGCS
jgi:hypothetical protein